MSEQIIQALTSPGAPFEFSSAAIKGHNCKVFKQANQCLSQLYANLHLHDEKDIAVYDGRRLSYAQARIQAATLAQTMASEFNIGVGSRVAIAMRNSPEWIVSFIAITSLGAIAALVNSRGSVDEINYSIGNTNCDLLILDSKANAAFNNSDTAPAITQQIEFDLAHSFSARTSNGVTLSEDTNAVLAQTDVDTDEVALILFTSGTTGRPKGALLTHRGALNALKANEFSGAIIGSVMAQKMGIDLQTLAMHQPQAATLLMFPLFHVSGCYSIFLANMIRGGKLVMLSRWSAKTALQAMQDEKVTTFPGVPTMYWDLLNYENFGDYDLSSLVSLSVAGQATPLSLLDKIKTAFPNAMMGIGYGMTETNGVISMLHGEEYFAEPHSVGKALPICEVKIIDESGSQTNAGQPGEICLRGATVMLGYDNQPQANQEVFNDGWFHTGDVGYLDASDKLFIVDRLTEMVIVGGENVYCAEVERVLSQAPDVIELTTFGMPDDRLGERLVALVRLHEDATQQTQDLLDWSATSLASYKVPAELHIIRKPLERNATGKVLKDKAKQIHKTIIESAA